MNKIAIGCGVLLLLLVLAVLGIVAFGYAIVKDPKFQAALKSDENQLVGVLQLGDVQIRPVSPTPEDTVSFQVSVTYGGTLAPGKDELEVRVLVQALDEGGVRIGTATLKKAVESAGDEVRGSATIRWGDLPKGQHKFMVSLLPPSHGLLGAIDAGKEVQVDVKEADSP